MQLGIDLYKEHGFTSADMAMSQPASTGISELAAGARSHEEKR
jgi:hypothetical protein